jgi:hypothetical protein
MEYWVWETDDVLILISNEGHLYKVDLIPPNPVFQHSIIPVPHGIWLRQSASGRLTYPRGPSFQCYRKYSQPYWRYYPTSSYRVNIIYNNTKFHKAVFSGCQKNVAVFKRFFLQPLMPLFLNLEHYDGKRYLVVVKKTLRYSNVFFYNHLCPYSLI